MNKSLKNQLMKLIMAESNIDKRIRNYNSHKTYFIKTHNIKEKVILYDFFKRTELFINQSSQCTYKNMWLIDINVSNGNMIEINYNLWHLFISNEIRDIYSHSYKEFEELLKKNKKLYMQLETK